MNVKLIDLKKNPNNKILCLRFGVDIFFMPVKCCRSIYVKLCYIFGCLTCLFRGYF